MGELTKLPEPTLLFRYDQVVEDPRDGLTLFGPLDEGKVYGVRAGIIGTPDAIRRFKSWVARIQHPILSESGRPPFPGFEAAFLIPWDPLPTLEIEISDEELNKYVFLDDGYQRVYRTVEVYSGRILEALGREESKIDLWFVVIPERVYKNCRPRSHVETSLQIKAEKKLPVRYAQTLQSQPSLLYPDDNVAAIPYQYELNFHNQLKARLLGRDALTQVIRETTIAPFDFLNQFGKPIRKVDEESAIAWNISSCVFYKVGGRPWKTASIRDGVCYIGLVFKRDEGNSDPRASCCAAQMFLDSGDGVVFRGAVGPWYVPEWGDFHLNQKAAEELVGIAIDTYRRNNNGNSPKELFLHGKVRFDDEEWEGFKAAVDSSTNLVGVRIREDNDFKLYRKGDHPVLRGLAYIRDDRTAYLWTKGYTPRLRTYPGREVPKPLLIDVCRGRVQIETVLNDIMALTKLNYNACIFADGLPVTLRFADAVGEILTAGPLGSVRPLQFKSYI